MVSRLALGSMLCLAIACGDEGVPVGSQDPQPLDWDGPALHKGLAMCPGGDDDEPKVAWEGYVENAVDPILAERVRLGLPQGDTAGFVLFASGPALPAPTGRDEVFACVDPQQVWLTGHRYEMLDAEVSERRLKFKIWRQEPYAPWCELQASSGPCGNQAKVYGDPCRDSRNKVVDCELMLLCNHCQCDDAGCRAFSAEVDDFSSIPSYASFDIAINGDRAEGSAFLENGRGSGKVLFYATE